MDDLVEFLSNDIFEGFNGLSTFEAFIQQAAHLLYEETHEKMTDENIESPIDEVTTTFFPSGFYDHDKLAAVLSKISEKKRQKTVKPEYTVRVKLTERIKNPKTGRMILKGSDCFNNLVDLGWIDKNGVALKEHKVRRLKNPKTGKLLTFGEKRFDMMVEEGWFDKEGNILQVRHPATKSPLNVKDADFKKFVCEGIFNPDGTTVEKSH